MTTVDALPKAELHIHIEGSLEPQMLLDLSLRNKVAIKYTSLAEIKQAYNFANLQEFLDIYYQGMSVLISEQDFFDLTYAYLVKAHQDNVTHSEIFFDPQGHLPRGISLQTIFNGMNAAIKRANSEFGIVTSIIPCFLRHLSEDDALRTFEKLMDYRDNFIGIGLDSSELGNPPSKFKNLFETARKEKLKLVAHAGEEGPANYVWEAVDVLGVDRIDHGDAIAADEELIRRVVRDQLALTMCPLSNRCLQVVPDLSEHMALRLLDKGVKVTLNSDDPAYFGGYINDNYRELATKLNLSAANLELFAKNSLDARFVK